MSLEYELMMARQRELAAMERELAQRAMVARFLRTERLERALKRVRATLAVPSEPAQVH